MKVFLSGYLRQVGSSLLIASLLCGTLLLSVGQASLLGAMLVGEGLAAIYFWLLARRLVRAARLSVAAGRWQVQMGLLLMLFLLFAAFWAMSVMSVSHFYAAVGGFLLMHALMMGRLIVREMRSDKR